MLRGAGGLTGAHGPAPGRMSGLSYICGAGPPKIWELFVSSRSEVTSVSVVSNNSCPVSTI